MMHKVKSDVKFTYYNNNNYKNLRIYIAYFSWRDDQLRITTIHKI